MHILSVKDPAFRKYGRVITNVDFTQLVEEMKKQLLMQLGPTPLNNPEYPRIVNGKHYRRLMGLLERLRFLTAWCTSPGSMLWKHYL